MNNEKNHTKKEVSFQQALLVILIILVTILVCAMILKSNVVTTFFITAVELLVISLILKFPYDEVEKVGFEYTVKAMPAFFILMAVGSMVAMWIAAGVVPTLIYAGLKIISPRIVLLMAMLLSSVASLATGTSWGSMATVGVAMMGIGESLGIPAPMVAGAVICGSYFGDKMSPFSDTTNITAAVTQTPLMTHIKHMAYEQAPSYLITLVIFTVLGLRYGGNQMDATLVDEITGLLSANFKISIIAVLPAVIVILMLVLHMPTFLSLTAGVFSGAAVAALYQGIPLTSLVQYMQKGFSIETGTEVVDKILNRGGIASMYDMAELVVLAMFISGILSHMGVMDAFIKPIIEKVKGNASLVFITMVLTYFLNAFAGSFTLSAVMTSTFMLPIYRGKGLRSENLSRAIEASGTYGGVMIPWNGHAVYASSTLGVATLSYLPFCFLNILSPIIVMIYAITGFSMTKYTDEEMKAFEEEEK